MGLMQGRILRDKIHRTWECLKNMEAFRLEQPGWMPFGLFRRLAAGKAAGALVPALRAGDPPMLERLAGIAEGCGLPLRSLCLMNAMEALLSTVQGRTVPAAGPGCSAVAVRGRRSRNGEPVVVRNFDYPPITQPYQTMRVSQPQNGLRSLEFLVAPQAGVVDGMNEAGLCITLNYAFMTDASTPAPLITMAIADALAQCTTTAQAIERITRRARWGAGMLMLADTSGDIASLELSNTRSAVRRPEPGEDCLAFTNVCRCPEMAAIQAPATEVFGDRVPTALRGQPVLAWHQDRADRIESLLRSRPAVSPEDLEQIMADHGPGGEGDGASPCVHTDYWKTTACLQWFPARRRARVSFSTACEAHYVTFDLGAAPRSGIRAA
jgi:hypothetical protein